MRNGLEGASTRIVSSRWMCLQRQEGEVHWAWWAASCHTELDQVHSRALALGTGQCLCPWDVPEERLLDSLLL